MRTKLSVFCDRVLETGWLLAVILAPLYFNVYSNRVFEPDKLSLVRSIALVMIAAWLIKVLDGSSWGLEGAGSQKDVPAKTAEADLRQRLLGAPLVVPTILLVTAYLLSTLLSVAPGISLWGSYVRLQGTYTTLSYIVIFFLMLSTMRRQEQVDRLCSTIILTSLPISLYGILQHYGLDSLPWTGDVISRVASNMGNSIFVAAYLIMALPITLARLLESFSTLLKEQESTISHALLAGCYTFVLSVQLICIFFTQSRGPWLGLLAGLYVFMLVALISLRRSTSDQSPTNSRDLVQALGFAIGSIPLGIAPAYVVAVALKRGWRWLWLSWVFHTLLIGAFLVLFNLPNTPLSSLRSMPYIGRLGQVFETETGTGKVRVLIWEGAIDLISDNPLRTLVGYGPETMHVAYNPHYPPDLAHYEARNASPDRSHNETFDALAITGVIGFIAYMLVFGGVFYYGLRWLGFMETERQQRLFLSLSIAGAALGTILPRVLQGSFVLAGVGLPVGLILGTSLYLMISAALFYRREGPATDLKRQLLLIGLFSAIVAHFVEIHFGIAIASTRVHFWVYVALFILLGQKRIQEVPSGAVVPLASKVVPPSDSPVEPLEKHRSKKARRQAKKLARQTPAMATERPAQAAPSLTTKLLVGSLLMAVLMFTLGFEFISNPLGEMDSLRIIQLSLTTLTARGDPRTSLGALWLLFLTWLVGALVVTSETERTSGSRKSVNWWLSALGTYTAVTLLVFVFGMAVYTSLIKPGRDIANTTSFFYLAMAVLGLAIALLFTLDTRLPQRLCRTATVWAYPILILVVVLVIFATNVSSVKADIYYKTGLKLEENQRWDDAIRFYNRAISLAPDQDYYYLFLGRAFMSKAQTATDAQERVRWYEESLKVLQSARDLNPLNTDHYANLARLHRNWADAASTPEERAQRLETAHNYFVEATKLSPRNAQLFNEWALVYMAKSDYEGALEKLNQSLALDANFAATYVILGNLYGLQGELDKTAEAYRQALVWDPRNAEAHSALGYVYYQQGNITDALSSNLEAVRLDPTLARAHSTLGLIYYQLGRVDEAIQENLRVLEIFPNDLVSHRNLSLLHQGIGRLDDALSHAQTALELSPESDKPALQAFIDQLKAQQQATAESS